MIFRGTKNIRKIWKGLLGPKYALGSKLGKFVKIGPKHFLSLTCNGVNDVNFFKAAINL